MLILCYINLISAGVVCNLDVCFSLQFDEEFLSRQEAQAQLVKCDEKIAELQAELQAFRSQVNDCILLFSMFCELCSFFRGM